MNNNFDWDAWHNELVKKYGNDRNVMGLSLIALLDDAKINPSYSDNIREAIDEWRDSLDYMDYYTGRLEKKLLEIDSSESMKNLCHRIAVHVYHREEGRNI